MDSTFKTNKDGLFLGADGPLGVHISTDGMPHMRFMPVLLLLAEAEKKETLRLLLRLFLELLGKAKYTDAFLDMACLHGAQAELGDSIFLHSCLQHTKTDVLAALVKDDEKTGKVWLQRPELKEVIEWLEFSAWLPCDLGFDVFWRSILERLKAGKPLASHSVVSFAFGGFIGSNLLDGR